jgi:nucleotide-binding universal stress UspA family protein
MRIPSKSPVVAAVTGTSAGLAAVRLAAREAVARGRTLTVVHAFTWPSPRSPEAAADPGPARYDLARRAASRVVEEAVATAQRSTPGVRAAGQLLDGLPDRVLVQLSRRADLLVLGDDDLATTPWLPSSCVLAQVAARAWCPVVVARGPRPPAGPVLAAVDGSACSLLALRYAVAEARRRAEPLEVAYVLTESGPRAEEQGRQVLAAATALLGELPRSRTRLLTGPPGPALVRASGAARLAVLGPRGAHAAGLLGSVAREVLHHGACPTVFVHGSPGVARTVRARAGRAGNALAG